MLCIAFNKGRIANWGVLYNIIGSQTSQEDRSERTVLIPIAAVD